MPNTLDGIEAKRMRFEKAGGLLPNEYDQLDTEVGVGHIYV